ncbi:ABC transporter ATP-binding protein [Microbacterium oxydans]|uniref:Oligopeptide transport ATP-binding protein OppD n=1 Tax=Microbacterium oxydans TaxID=82380 RepID=A0A0F0L8C9_9MICO|nr:ABC transporter ATP-binding protein [Microbacterium oxydans]KJL29388.1 Oligopeptide transport ATP-binding protein OppD [Microbacterium oxydans]
MTAIRISDLALEFTGATTVRALDGVDLDVADGSSVAIVGESGSGKSTLAAAIGRLQPRSASIVRGQLEVDGIDVLGLDDDALRAYRRDTLAYIAQDPIGSLDPTMRIGAQLRLILRAVADDDSVARQVELLAAMQISDPARVIRLFPHQVSGGMAQRVAIAMAMCRRPKLLIADEPTAALDSQVREEVIRLLFTQAQEQGTTIIWLSHDLPAVARWCDQVAVMYAGRVVERGPAAAVLGRPVHPYSRALAATDPSRARRGERLASIPGSPPVLHGESEGCAFAARCAHRIDACEVVRPEPLGERHSLCIRAAELVDADHRAGSHPGEELSA